MSRPTIDTILRRAPVIPVIVLDDAAQAVPLARALIEGGLPVLEVTLRTAAGIDAIARLIAEAGDAVVGAGTVTEAAEIESLARLGAHFAVSPGITPDLLAAAAAADLPLLPGVMTTSELMLGRGRGLTCFKFFPAAQAGGPGLLKAWGGPFPDLRFCPTGGVGPENAGEYLSLANVPCVGSTWVAPRDWIAAGRWPEITSRALAACAWIPGSKPP